MTRTTTQTNTLRPLAPQTKWKDESIGQSHEHPRNGGITSTQIRARAYEIYQSRMSQGASGDCDGDWQQAEHELQGSCEALDSAPPPSAASFLNAGPTLNGASNGLVSRGGRR